MLCYVCTLTYVSLQGKYLYVAVGGYIDLLITTGKLPLCCGRWVQTFRSNIVTPYSMNFEVPTVLTTLRRVSGKLVCSFRIDDTLLFPEDGSNRFLRHVIAVYQTAWRHILEEGTTDLTRHYVLIMLATMHVVIHLSCQV